MLEHEIKSGNAKAEHKKSCLTETSLPLRDHLWEVRLMRPPTEYKGN